jgi:hypothetical protein
MAEEMVVMTAAELQTLLANTIQRALQEWEEKQAAQHAGTQSASSAPDSGPQVACQVASSGLAAKLDAAAAAPFGGDLLTRVAAEARAATEAKPSAEPLATTQSSPVSQSLPNWAPRPAQKSDGEEKRMTSRELHWSKAATQLLRYDANFLPKRFSWLVQNMHFNRHYSGRPTVLEMIDILLKDTERFDVRPTTSCGKFNFDDPLLNGDPANGQAAAVESAVHNQHSRPRHRHPRSHRSDRDSFCAGPAHRA